jgi:hypothetical protein
LIYINHVYIIENLLKSIEEETVIGDSFMNLYKKRFLNKAPEENEEKEEKN